MTVPVLTTGRLVLRGFALADFPAYAALWADPAVVRYILPGPRAEGESWRVFQGIVGGWALLGHGQWAVAERETGRVVGHTGFFRAMRGLGADFDAAPECGWVFGRDVWGRGYAAEAVGAAHGWFDGSGHGPASVAMIEAGHAGSERIAASLGYRALRTVTVSDTPVALFRRG